jgi:hypothetical protein
MAVKPGNTFRQTSKKIMENKAPDLQMRPDDILYIPNSLTKVFGARGAEARISAGTGILVWR